MTNNYQEDLFPLAIRADLDREIDEFKSRLASFEKKESSNCPYCEAEASSVEQVGEGVYIFPCHHKLYKGDIPEAWKKPEEPAE